MFRLTHLTLVHSLWLLFNCYRIGDNLQLYACACMSISCEFIEEYVKDPTDWLYICNQEYTVDQLINTRNHITVKRNGIVRVITPLDIIHQKQYDSQPMEHADNIVVLCYMYQSSFITIPANIFADACVEVIQSLNNDFACTPLVSNIRWMLQDISSKSLTNITSGVLRTLNLFKSITNIPFNTMLVGDIPTTTPYVPLNYEELPYSLGKGTYSDVRLGLCNNVTVAIKQQWLDDDYGKCMMELSILSTYQHPNIIKLLGFDITNQYMNLVMETGVSLHLMMNMDAQFTLQKWKDVYINRKPEYVLPDRYQLMDDIVTGVKYLHSVGVLHLDIKLQNIVVINNGGRRVAKLIDFGLSQVLVLTPNDTNKRTWNMQSIMFRCPELLMADEDINYTFGPDVWSVGVTLLAMEMGMLPFLYVNMTTECYINPSRNMLDNIGLLLPDKGDETNDTLPMVSDAMVRNRILGMLQFDPVLRVLA